MRDLVTLLVGAVTGMLIAAAAALYSIVPIKRERDQLRGVVRAWKSVDEALRRAAPGASWQEVQLPLHHQLERAEATLRAWHPEAL